MRIPSPNGSKMAKFLIRDKLCDHRWMWDMQHALLIYDWHTHTHTQHSHSVTRRRLLCKRFAETANFSTRNHERWTNHMSIVGFRKNMIRNRHKFTVISLLFSVCRFAVIVWGSVAVYLTVEEDDELYAATQANLVIFHELNYWTKYIEIYSMTCMANSIQCTRFPVCLRKSSPNRLRNSCIESVWWHATPTSIHSNNEIAWLA